MAANEFADVTVGQLTGVAVEQTGHVGQFADVTVGQFTGVEVVSNVFADVVVGLIVGVKSRVQTSL